MVPAVPSHGRSCGEGVLAEHGDWECKEEKECQASREHLRVHVYSPETSFDFLQLVSLDLRNAAARGCKIYLLRRHSASIHELRARLKSFSDGSLHFCKLLAGEFQARGAHS